MLERDFGSASRCSQRIPLVEASHPHSGGSRRKAVGGPARCGTRHDADENRTLGEDQGAVGANLARGQFVENDLAVALADDDGCREAGHT